jgi:iron complex outermembrane receptor protein
MTRQRRSSTRSAWNTISLAALAAAFAAPVLAQSAEPTEPATTIDDVVVTGTLVRGIAPVGAPVIGINAEDMLAAGVSNTVELLRKVPQISNIGMDDGRSNSSAGLQNSNSTQGSGINMRGLGTQATLTLTNGFRPAPSGLYGLYFDPSTIPTIALQGVEVVADGASALYGSDAVAGVANLIFKRRYEGAQIDARYGMADDWSTQQISGIVGKRWESGGVMLAAEYSHRDVLWAADRPQYFTADLRPYGGTDLRTNFSYPANIVVGGTVYGVPANPAGLPLTFADLSTTPNLLSGWAGATARPEQTRQSYVATGDYRFANGVELYGQAFHTKRDVDKILGRVGLASLQSTLTLRNTNPWFITGIPGVGATQSVRYSWLDQLGPEDSSGWQTNWQAVAGARFDLPAGWRGDISVSRSRNEDMRLRVNQFNQCALTGSATSASGPCTVPTGQIAGGAIAQTNPALAFNPYGPNSDALLDSLRASIRQWNYYEIDAIQAKFDGELFSLPAGPVRAAVGLGWSRHEEGRHNTQNNDTADNSVVRVATTGSLEMQIASLFGEVVVPVISKDQAVPFVQGLRLSLAGRYEDYDLFGSTTNPKVGFTWEVNDSLQVRGSYGTSFKVSMIQADPGVSGGPTTRQLADYRSATGQTLAMTQVGGNPDLGPETSETWTLGVNFNPAWLPGASLSATYFNIGYDDIIDTPGNSVINNGLTSAAREALYGAYIRRRPTDAAGSAAFTDFIRAKYADPQFIVAGGIPDPANVNIYVDGRGYNAGSLSTSGLDLQASYGFETEWGDIEIGAVGTYFFNFDRSQAPTLPKEDVLGLIEFPNTWNLRVNLGWSQGPWKADTFVNHSPSYTNNFVTPVAKVDAYTSVDATIGYDFGERYTSGPLAGLRASLEIQNLFNADVPVALVANQPFDSAGPASVIGRFAAIRLSKAF